MAGWLHTVGQSSNGNAGAGNFSITPTQNVTAGNTLILAIAIEGSQLGTVSVTDSAGNTYTNRADGNQGVGAPRLIVFVAENVLALTTSQSISVVNPTSPGAYACDVEEYQGLATSSFDAVSAAATGDDVTLTITSNTLTTTAVDVVLGIAGVGQSDTSGTADLIFGTTGTKRGAATDGGGNQGLEVVVEDRVLSAAGSGTAAFHTTSNHNYVMFAMGLTIAPAPDPVGYGEPQTSQYAQLLGGQ